MTLTEIIDYSRPLGIALGARDGRLMVKSPKGALTPELRQALLEHKPVLLRLLGAPARPRLVAANHSPRASKRPAVYKVTVAGRRVALINSSTAPPAMLIAQIDAQFGTGRVEAIERL